MDLSLFLRSRGAEMGLCQLVHLSCTGNLSNPQSSLRIEGRGCLVWDRGVTHLGCARPPCQACLPTPPPGVQRGKRRVK